MKISLVGPSDAKPIKEELLARVETLSRKSRRAKRKTLDSVKKDCPALGKVPKLGASSSSPSTHVRISGQVLLPPAEIPKALSPVLALLQRQKTPQRTAEQPLEVMPITVWNPPAQSVKPPSSREKELKRKVSKLKEMATPCSSMPSLRRARSRPSLKILTSRGWAHCPLRKLWLYPSRGSPL